MKLSNNEKINLVNALFDHLEQNALSINIHTEDQNYLNVQKEFLEKYNSKNLRDEALKRMQRFDISGKPENLNQIFKGTLESIQHIPDGTFKSDTKSKTFIEVASFFNSGIKNAINASEEIINNAYLPENREPDIKKSSKFTMTGLVKSVRQFFSKEPGIIHKPISLEQFDKTLEDRQKEFPEVYRLLAETKIPTVRTPNSLSHEALENWATKIRTNTVAAFNKIGLPASALSCGSNIHFEHNPDMEKRENILGSFNTYIPVGANSTVNTFIVATQMMPDDLAIQSTIQHEYFHAVDQLAMQKIIQKTPDYVAKALNLAPEDVSIVKFFQDARVFGSNAGMTNIGKDLPSPTNADEESAYNFLSNSRDMTLGIYNLDNAKSWDSESKKIGAETIGSVKFHILANILPGGHDDMLSISTENLSAILKNENFKKVALAFMSHVTNPHELKENAFEEPFKDLYSAIAPFASHVKSFKNIDGSQMGERKIYDTCKEKFLTNMVNLREEIASECMTNGINFDRRFKHSERDKLYDKNQSLENIRYIGLNEHVSDANITDVLTKTRYWSANLEVVARVAEKLQDNVHHYLNGKGPEELISDNMQVTHLTKLQTLEFLHSGVKILGEEPLCSAIKTSSICDSKLFKVKISAEDMKLADELFGLSPQKMDEAYEKVKVKIMDLPILGELQESTLHSIQINKDVLNPQEKIAGQTKSKFNRHTI